MLTPAAGEDKAVIRYKQLQQTLIAAWTANDLPQEVDGIAPQRLTQALNKLSFQPQNPEGSPVPLMQT